MIGIVVISHNDIGAEMLTATKRILPDCANIVAVSIESNLPPEAGRLQIEKAIRSVDQKEGIILLSDMFGGTPSNLCLSFLKKGKIEVIGGVNLPMLIKLASLNDKMELTELAGFIKKYGQKNIVIASEVLEGKIEH